MNDDHALVLFSGGQDSTTCLAWALDRYPRVETIGFTYGQRHAVELGCREPLAHAANGDRPSDQQHEDDKNKHTDFHIWPKVLHSSPLLPAQTLSQPGRKTTAPKYPSGTPFATGAAG